MPATAMGLALCFLGAVFVYRSTCAVSDRSDSTGETEEPGLDLEERGETERWFPDQDPNRIVRWLRARDKTRIGFLLLAAGFAFQLLGFFVPGSRIVS